MKLDAKDFRAVAQDAVDRAAVGLRSGAADGDVLNELERAVAAMAEVFAYVEKEKAEYAALVRASADARARRATQTDPYA